MTQKTPLNARMMFLFQRYIDNQCNAAELEELLKKLKVSSSDIDDDLEVITYSLWKSIKRTKPDSNQHLLKLKKEALEIYSNSIQVKTKPVRQLFSRKRYRTITVAASLLILLGSSIWLYNTNPLESYAERVTPDTFIKTNNSKIKTINLPDGTQIMLNKGSQLALNKQLFNKNNREIWLEGEAFFEVAKNPKKAFIIHNKDLKTTVLGTSFNIKAYPQLNNIIVSVRSGRVKITQANETLGILIQNKQLSYQFATHKNEITNANWKDAAGWREGRLIFRRAGIEELKLRLKQHFNVDLQIIGNALTDESTLFNSSFAKETNLKEVMDVISATTNVAYKINGNRKVILYSRK